MKKKKKKKKAITEYSQQLKSQQGGHNHHKKCKSAEYIQHHKTKFQRNHYPVMHILQTTSKTRIWLIISHVQSKNITHSQIFKFLDKNVQTRNLKKFDRRDTVLFI